MNSIYLTIDDGPSDDFRNKVNFLSSKKIPAIFFCTGRNIEKKQDDLIYAIKKGFVIGNHAYSHKAFSQLSAEECLEEIRKTDKLTDSCYKTAKVKRPAKVFRFPYGDKGAAYLKDATNDEKRTRILKIQNLLKKFGYSQPLFKGITHEWFHKQNLDKFVDVYWTFDIEEWKLRKSREESDIRSLNDVMDRIDKNMTGGESNEIILMHDHAETSAMFKKIIEKLMSKGFKFKLPEFS